MSKVRQRSYEKDGQKGFLYDFEEPGSKIPVHAHEPSDFHNVICLRGVLLVEFPDDGESAYLEAGDPPYEFDGSRRHEVRSLVPGAQCLNIYHGPKPTKWAPGIDITVDV